jgi:hypothetical protein
MLSLLLAGALAASAAPARVTVGAYVNDIHNLELASHSFAGDFYVWFKWKDARLDPASSAEFMNPYELWGHVRTTSYPKPQRLPDGSFYQVMRVQGRFASKLPLDDYPFDKQTLYMELEDSSRTREEIVFEADAQPVSRDAQLKLPGFTVGMPRLRVREHDYATAFGDPRAKGPAVFSRLRVEVPIERPAFTYSVKLLLPLLCVIFCAALIFLFDPRHVDARVGIGITALLTIVALQITLNEDLPDVDYLVLMDKIYLAAYVFVIAALAMVVVGTKLAEKDQNAKAMKLERRALIGLLLSFFGVLLLVVGPVLR